MHDLFVLVTFLSDCDQGRVVLMLLMSVSYELLLTKFHLRL